MKIKVINGPNINMIGIREPAVYGKGTYAELIQFISDSATELDVEVEHYQSNCEGDIVTAIQDCYQKFDGIVINPAAYTHTSVAILDAVKAVSIPTVEVHISDVSKREDFRQISYIRSACIKTIAGKGFEGYKLAMQAIISYLQPDSPVEVEPNQESSTPITPSNPKDFKINYGSLKKYRGRDSHVVIPDTVTSWIDEKAFYKCKSLKSVIIPNSVQWIGPEAFKECESLESVTIGNSVTTIYSYAFSDCTSLKSVTIGNSVTSIGYRAFYWCKSLESVTIGNSVTSIGSSAFCNCTSLENIIIPSSVTIIESYAFAYCDNLTIYCEAESKPETWADDWNPRNRPVVWGYKQGYQIISNVLLRCYIDKTQIKIPKNVTSIGKNAFDSCKSLESMTIPDSVTSIGDSAFSYCTSLESIIIPSSVITIESYAFARCNNLTIYCEAKSKPDTWADDWNPSNRPVVWGYVQQKSKS